MYNRRRQKGLRLFFENHFLKLFWRNCRSAIHMHRGRHKEVRSRIICGGLRGIMGFIKKNGQKKEEADTTENKEYQFPEEAALKECRHCRMMIPKTAKICPNCKKRLKRNTAVLGLLICLIAVCGAGVYYYLKVYVPEHTAVVEVMAESAEETETAENRTNGETASNAGEGQKEAGSSPKTEKADEAGGKDAAETEPAEEAGKADSGSGGTEGGSAGEGREGAGSGSAENGREGAGSVNAENGREGAGSGSAEEDREGAGSGNAENGREAAGSGNAEDSREGAGSGSAENGREAAGSGNAEEDRKGVESDQESAGNGSEEDSREAARSGSAGEGRQDVESESVGNGSAEDGRGAAGNRNEEEGREKAGSGNAEEDRKGAESDQESAGSGSAEDSREAARSGSAGDGSTEDSRKAVGSGSAKDDRETAGTPKKEAARNVEGGDETVAENDGGMAEEAMSTAGADTEIVVLSASELSDYTEEEFREICRRIDYKKLLRSQETYLNGAVMEELTVIEQVDGGLFDENIYYLCKREDGQGITRYYIVRDDRPEDDTPILAGDVIQVYGQLFGSCKLPGYLVKTQPVVPALTIVYFDLLAE